MNNGAQNQGESFEKQLSTKLFTLQYAAIQLDIDNFPKEIFNQIGLNILELQILSQAQKICEFLKMLQASFYIEEKDIYAALQGNLKNIELAAQGEVRESQISLLAISVANGHSLPDKIQLSETEQKKIDVLALGYSAVIGNASTFNNLLPLAKKHQELYDQIYFKILHIASKNEDISILNLLINEKSDNRDKFVVLEYAVQYGSFKVLNAFLQYACTYQQEKLFVIAAKYSQLDVVKFFLKTIRISDEKQGEALELALLYGKSNNPVFQYLLENHVYSIEKSKFDDYVEKAFKLAMKWRSAFAVKLILENAPISRNTISELYSLVKWHKNTEEKAVADVIKNHFKKMYPTIAFDFEEIEVLSKKRKFGITP